MEQMNLNVTFITFAGHVELQKYRFVYFSVMCVVYVLIICSNLTILCLIWTQTNLHEPMYVFIGALLFNSLLFSTNIYPKLLLDFLSEQQRALFWQCQLQSFFYYTLCGAEFLLLSAMAYDRYVSICRPLRYHSEMRRSTVGALLLASWLLPALQLLPSLFLSNHSSICSFAVNGIFCNNAISQLYCMSSKTSYIIYGIFIVLNTIFVPLLFIVFTYTKILVISYKSSVSVRRKALQTCSPHLLVLISFSCLCSYDIVIARLQIDLNKTLRLIMTLQVVLYHPLFNPLIYGLKSRRISEHLRRLFGSRRRDITHSETHTGRKA